LKLQPMHNFAHDRNLDCHERVVAGASAMEWKKHTCAERRCSSCEGTTLRGASPTSQDCNRTSKKTTSIKRLKLAGALHYHVSFKPIEVR
jgi:hypothetical protein